MSCIFSKRNPCLSFAPCSALPQNKLLPMTYFALEDSYFLKLKAKINKKGFVWRQWQGWREVGGLSSLGAQGLSCPFHASLPLRHSWHCGWFHKVGSRRTQKAAFTSLLNPPRPPPPLGSAWLGSGLVKSAVTEYSGHRQFNKPST